METGDTLGDVLKAKRQSTGESQERVANRLKTTQSTLGRWETGDAAPSPENYPILEKYLGVTTAELGSLISLGLARRLRQRRVR